MIRLGLLFVASLLLALTSLSVRAEAPLRLGWTAWADGVFVTELAARLIEDRLDQPVELVRAGIAEQYQGLASGRIDAMLMSWQPLTHEPYLERVGTRVEDLGIIYGGARLGWAVPAYVDEDRVRSIADLRDAGVRARFDGRIVGIDPDSGLMRLSRLARSEYGLEDYVLDPGSGPAMTAALAEAIEAREWIVVTAWSPHWIFAAHDLRYLADPRGTLGQHEQVHALARRGLHTERPRVGALLTRMWLPLAELEAALLEAERSSVREAVDHYIASHPERVEYWLTGRQ